jgi:hypothetical protein
VTGSAYNQSTAPINESNPNTPVTNFYPNGSGQTALAQNWWYYRVQGDTRERPFGVYTKSDGFNITGTSQYNGIPGPTSTYNWTENGASGVRFTAHYVATISNDNPFQPNPLATLSQSFQITNPNATPLTISLFNVVFWTAGAGFNGRDEVVSGSPNSLAIDGGAYHATHTAVTPATAFEVAESSTLQNLLTNGTVDDFNNTGSPGVYTFATTGYEWALTVPANSSLTVQSNFTGHTIAVPEPSALWLAAGGVATFVVRRRRFCRRAG